ncbi:MAG: hypothetical protein M1839_004326 [Geoglossum umbratile]|nr:MAG: hypothetical protein M1839_004326 [Geoglossum umbratile]
MEPDQPESTYFIGLPTIFPVVLLTILSIADHTLAKRSDQPGDEDTFKHPQQSPKRHRSLEDVETSSQAKRSKKPPSKPLSRPQSLPAGALSRNAPTTPFEPQIEKAATPYPKADDTKRPYRCPQCLFPCWVCNTSGVHRQVGGEAGGRSEAIQPEAKQPEALQLEEMSGDPTGTPVTATAETGTNTAKRRQNTVSRAIGLGHRISGSGVTVLATRQRLQPSDLPKDEIQDGANIGSSVHLQISSSSASEIYARILQALSSNDEMTFNTLVTRYLTQFGDPVNPDGPQGVFPCWREKWNPYREGRAIGPSEWNVDHDRTHMVAINLFNESHRDGLQSTFAWLFADPLGVCPYLTIGLGFGENMPTRASGVAGPALRISAASAAWLFQRKKLKDEIGSRDYSDLRHYSVTFLRGDFQIWQAKVDGEGYSVQEIGRGSFTLSESQIQRYAKWVNAIHDWGLGPNARAFKRDVEALIDKTS